MDPNWRRHQLGLVDFCPVVLGFKSYFVGFWNRTSCGLAYGGPRTNTPQMKDLSPCSCSLCDPMRDASNAHKTDKTRSTNNMDTANSRHNTHRKMHERQEEHKPHTILALKGRRQGFCSGPVPGPLEVCIVRFAYGTEPVHHFWGHSLNNAEIDPGPQFSTTMMKGQPEHLFQQGEWQGSATTPSFIPPWCKGNIGWGELHS